MAKKYFDALDAILDRPIAFNPSFKKITGSTNAALLLSQGFYWSKRTQDPEGWFWKTRAEWTEETGLTEDELDGARAKCKAVGVMEEKLKGVPATLYYRVNRLKVYELLGVQFPEKSETEIPETPESGFPGNSQIPEKQESGTSGNINKESETTPKITTSEPELSESEIAEANRLVDAIIANDKAPGKMNYSNRDKMPEMYLPLCDFYVNMIGKDPDGKWIQVPTKRVLMDWMHTFQEWLDENLKREHVQAAWERANDPERGFPVGRPGALTNTAVAMKSQKVLSKSKSPAVNQQEVERTKKDIEQKQSQNYVPRPAYVGPPRIGTQTTITAALAGMAGRK